MSQREGPSQLPLWVQAEMKKVDAADEAQSGEPRPANDSLSNDDSVYPTLMNMRLADTTQRPMSEDYDALLLAEPKVAFAK